MNWTKENDALLIKLRDTGLSYEAIARVLSKETGHRLTRNSCVGRAHRIDMPISARQSERMVSRRTRRAPPKPQQQTCKPSPLASLPTSPLPQAQDYDVPRVAFADLEPHHCRFPVGEPTQGFCGHSKVTGLAYCEVHSRRCYTPARSISDAERERRRIRTILNNPLPRSVVNNFGKTNRLTLEDA